MFGTLVPYHRPRRGNAISRVRPAVCLDSVLKTIPASVILRVCGPRPYLDVNVIGQG